MENNGLGWSGRSWRLPAWLWLGLAAMAVGTLHILLDAGVGLFPSRGRLAPAVAAALLLISLVHAWWGVSLAAGARGVGGGVASAVRGEQFVGNGQVALGQQLIGEAAGTRLHFVR